jgi:type I restriction enzyme S subunit
MATDGLPEGWLACSLGEVVDYGKTAKAEPSEIEESAWILELEDIEKNTSKLLERRTFADRQSKSTKNRFEVGDVLYGKLRPYLNKVIIADQPGYCTTEIIPLKCNAALDNRYLFYWLKHPSFLDYVGSVSHGLNMPRLGTEAGKAAPFILAPVAEQKRIADKLQAVLGRVDACRARLDRLPDVLKRLRQSVLTAATSGQLTEDWREQEPRNRSAEALAARIRKRHADAGGHKIGNAAPPSEEIHDLSVDMFPDGWQVITLRELVLPDRPITYGILMPGPELKQGVPYVRVADFPNERLNLATIRNTSPQIDEQFKRSRLRTGDLLMSIRGTVGRMVVVPQELEGANITQDTARLSVQPDVSSAFVLWCLRSSSAQTRMRAATKGVAVRGINIGDVRALQVPLPPIEEQQEIVRRLEALFDLADGIEARVGKTRAQVESLTPSILVKAFRGELIPQDAIDEPAAVILSRLQAAKEVVSPRREGPPPKKQPPSHPHVNKTKTAPASFTHAKLAGNPLTDFKLRSFKVEGQYGSLRDFSLELRDDVPSSLAPICMVGLNGSGKSNALEALSEIFTYLELLHLPWKKLGKKRSSSLLFDVRYAAKLKGQQFREFRVSKSTKEGAQYFEIKKGGEALKITDPMEQLASLPRRIVGYSSGLNETLSIPYFKTKALYAREVREAAIKKPADLVADTRTLFMDYESNAAILLTNFLFARPAKLKIFDRFLRVGEIESFKLRFNFKPPGLSQKVKLTDQLKDHLNKIAKCAGASFNANGGEQSFEFGKATDYRATFGKAFPNGGAEFFMALYRLSLLNALCLTGKQRDLYEKRDPRAGIVERPPTVPSFDRIFSIDDLQLRLSAPNTVAPYAALSDGDHQFIQIFGTIMLFDEPGTLFLLDEPESHFNPEWRSKFVTILDDVGAVLHQELALSTHSPFIVSGCRGKYVFKFKRDKGDVTCAPVGFETYGSSFDYLLGKLFDIDALVATQALDEMREVFDHGNLAALEDAVGEFGESFEKRFLFQRIAEKKAAKRKRFRSRTAKARK